MMIQSIMLVALGFFIGALLTLVLLPAFWRRAVRLTTERIMSSMPVSLSEIRADKDQLRADFAIKIRHAEVELEKARTRIAKQRIELSRRDSEIDSLQSRIAALSTNLEEQNNAKKVLEQTVASRLPKLEAQLDKAKELLGVRFQEITKLKVAIDQQEDKLDEARQRENVRQSEFERMRLALDQSYEEKRSAEVALEQRAEFDALLAKNKELESEVRKITEALFEAKAREEEETTLLKAEMHGLADQIMARTNGAAQPESIPAKSESTVDGSDENAAVEAPTESKLAGGPEDQIREPDSGGNTRDENVVEDGSETADDKESARAAAPKSTKKRQRLGERLKSV